MQAGEPTRIIHADALRPKLYDFLNEVTPMAVRTRNDQSGLDGLDTATSSARDAVHFRRIIKAREALAAADQELRDAVRAAREAGDSWTIIGAALDTTRQAAQQRFGND